jgi:hypothetical protein
VIYAKFPVYRLGSAIPTHKLVTTKNGISKILWNGHTVLLSKKVVIPTLIGTVLSGLSDGSKHLPTC